MRLEDMHDFAQATLDEYMSAPGRAMQLTNELLQNNYEFADLMAANPIKLQGGERIHWDVLIRRSDAAGFVAPWSVREVRQPQHLEQGTIDWSFFETHWAIEETEQMLNAGPAKLLDLMEVRQEGAITEAHNTLEDIFWDALGNFFNLGQENNPFPGIKSWITRDGVAVDGSASVFGVSTTTYPKWLSRYCGPLGSNLNRDLAHDANDGITSANQLLRKMKKALRYCRFASPNGLKFAQDDKKANLIRSQKIWCDEIAMDAYQAIQEAVGHGNEAVGPKELDKGDPVFRGIPLTFVEQLGLDAAGLPTQAAHNSGRGNLVAGQYGHTGEMFMVPLKNFRVILHDEMSPLRPKLALLETQRVFWQLLRWALTLVCNSRQRCVYLWGFSPLTTT